MAKWAGTIAAIILGLLSLLHAYWVVGGRRGFQTAVPADGKKPLFIPSPFASLVVAAGLLAGSLTVLGRVGVWGQQWPQALFRWGTRGLAAIFMLRTIGDFKWVGFFKQVKDTEFAVRDTRFYSPLTLLLSLLALLTELDDNAWLARHLNKIRPSEGSEGQFFIWLGTGWAAGLDVGNKGGLLDQAKRAGLAVPRGLILLDQAWQQALNTGLVTIQADSVVVPDAAALLESLRLPRFDQPLAIRSAFAAEDRQAESLAGFFTSKLSVASDNPVVMATALAEVWGSALKRPGQFRRDVLIMEMVPAQQAGVAFTEAEFEDDLINYTAGTAEVLVSGAVEGLTLHLPKLRAWENWRPGWPLQPRVVNSEQGAGDKPPLAFSRRLQTLLRDARRTFGSRDWDIEWADDGERCWLIQIRPVTRPSRRNEAFTSANLKEILPDLPSRFMATTITACGAGLFAYYRHFDPTLPHRRPISETFYGRPFFNISLLTEMMRHWGLPSRLVTGNIGGEADQDYGFNIGRFFSKTFVLLKIGLAQARAVSSAEQTIQTILTRTERVEPTFTANVNTLESLFTLLVTEMFSLTSAMSGPLLLLRRLGVLAEHNARQRTISTEMYTDLEPLRIIAAHNDSIRSALAQGQLPEDAKFQYFWQAYLHKHGHRGVYESDIARPRLHEAPESLLTSLAQPFAQPQPPPPRTWLGRLSWPIWWQASRNMQMRELLRYYTIIGFDRIRRVLLALADEAVAQGVLPDREALWLLESDEVRHIDHGWRPDADFFARRKAEIEHLAAYDLPDLFYRFDDLEQYHVDQQDRAAYQARRLHGISLTTGQVSGTAWVLTEPSTDLPTGFTSENTILVARSVDAGWIPTFTSVAGAVVEIGGDLSHGSIILREIGLPAITNVRGATRSIQTGDKLVLKAGQGVVEKG